MGVQRAHDQLVTLLLAALLLGILWTLWRSGRPGLQLLAVLGAIVLFAVPVGLAVLNKDKP